jgi:hypothetical protein
VNWWRILVDKITIAIFHFHFVIFLFFIFIKNSLQNYFHLCNHSHLSDLIGFRLLYYFLYNEIFCLKCQRLGNFTFIFKQNFSRISLTAIIHIHAQYDRG